MTKVKTKRKACLQLMLSALETVDGLKVTFVDSAEAIGYRFACYNIRDGARLLGDVRFDQLRFLVRGNTLEIHRDGVNDSNSIREIQDAGGVAPGNNDETAKDSRETVTK